MKTGGKSVAFIILFSVCVLYIYIYIMEVHGDQNCLVTNILLKCVR